jgi:hypothetical protein
MEKVRGEDGEEKKVHAHEESFFVNAQGDPGPRRRHHR